MDAPVLSIEGFEGPLDWLLEMVRAQRIDLAKLSIAALVEVFAAALDRALAPQSGAGAAGLARWGDWMVMAVTLTLLRSRLLLPADVAEVRAAQDEAEALRHRLVSRAEMAAATDWLERQPQLGREVFTRGGKPLAARLSGGAAGAGASRRVSASAGGALAGVGRHGVDHTVAQREAGGRGIEGLPAEDRRGRAGTRLPLPGRRGQHAGRRAGTGAWRGA